MSYLRSCLTCGQEKGTDEFPKQGGLRCLTCFRARVNARRRAVWHSNPDVRKRISKTTRAWEKKNPDKIKLYSIGRNRRLREKILARYGGACECCGETVFEFLSIDHVNGGGTKERRETGTKNICQVLNKSTERLSGYRVLCHNCNSSLGYYGYCPHQSQGVMPSVI